MKFINDQFKYIAIACLISFWAIAITYIFKFITPTIWAYVASSAILANVIRMQMLVKKIAFHRVKK